MLEERIDETSGGGEIVLFDKNKIESKKIGPISKIGRKR